LYSLVPWIGVIAVGYAFGVVLMLDPGRRRRICFAIGIGAIVAFVVLHGLNLYGDPRPWRMGLDFLNATKYPASLSGRSKRLAVRESPDGATTTARGLHMESAPALWWMKFV
jgi:uncharacterized membrane protein